MIFNMHTVQRPQKIQRKPKTEPSIIYFDFSITGQDVAMNKKCDEQKCDEQKVGVPLKMRISTVVLIIFS